MKSISSSFTRITIILFIVMFLVSGCQAFAPRPSGLSDEQVQTVTENILQALNEGDYEGFTAGFSDQMKNAFPEAEFSNLQTLLADKSGDFISCAAPALSNNQGYAVYRLPCQFELEEVTVTITFQAGGEQVEGLFFTSENLRQ